MPTYIDKDKYIDFPAVRYVGSHMQTLVWLPTHSAFAYVKAGHLQFNTLRTGDANLCLYAYKQFKYPGPNVLRTTVISVFG
jgi:hypothetical protein